MKKLTQLIAVSAFLCLSGCSSNISECEYEIVSSSKSPDRTLTAYLIDVGCGATTGFVSWVAVSETEITLNQETQRTAVLEGKAKKIYWIDKNILGVTGNVTVFKIEDANFEIIVE